MLPSGKQTVLLAVFLGLVVPAIVRVVSSPVTIILLLPLLALLAAIGFLSSNIVLAYALDATRTPPRNALPTAARPLAFSTPAAWQAVLTRSQWSHKAPQSLPSLYPEFPILSSALNDVLIMIVRDFVLVWYREISSSPSFPTAVSSTLHSSMEKFLEKLMTVDVSALVVKRILPKITAHIEQFRQSEVALRGAGLERKLTQSEELDLLLASRYAARGGGKLHAAVDNLSSTFTKQAEENHLRELVDKALPFVLPEKEAHSRAVKVVVREIVACTVLYPVMDMLADPDFWNRSIRPNCAAIRQQRLISKVRNILEAQIPRPQSRVAHAGTKTETITTRTDPRQFESFLRSITRCNSLLDARRLKNDVTGEIRRTRTLLATHAKEDWINGEKTEDIVAFLDRLYTAKRKVEKRIIILGGEADSRQTLYQEPEAMSPLTLRDVLINPSSLSYFMEFMDRRQRSLLVQFWLTVESFKNPLESVDSDSSDDEDDPILDPSPSTTLKEDISMMNELYFSGANENSTPVEEKRVRRSVMLAQRQVERDMEQDFEDFQRSELWFRVLADIETNGRKANLEPPLQHAKTDNPLVIPVSPTRPTRGVTVPPVPRPRGMHRSESTPSLGVPLPRPPILSDRFHSFPAW
ncbi:Sorting nexin-12 [Grifola frondosa]|uniref:Sorting nexin-12 n=1 Tax=Grifola frondosa TaxID=5627 RepID=A0A1C7MSU1_GRIFR|nr:Sorting nexin-12 [Grifola frondosa]